MPSSAPPLSMTRHPNSFSQSGLTVETISVPATTPGTNPRTIGDTRRHTPGNSARFTQRTYALSGTSMMTNAGLSTRFDRNNKASGTVIDENPYPSAPLMVAASSVIAARAIMC